MRRLFIIALLPTAFAWGQFRYGFRFGGIGLTINSLKVNTSAQFGNDLRIGSMTGSADRIVLTAATKGEKMWNFDNSLGTLRIFREDYAAYSAGGANGSVALSIDSTNNLTSNGTRVPLGTGSNTFLARWTGANTFTNSVNLHEANTIFSVDELLAVNITNNNASIANLYGSALLSGNYTFLSIGKSASADQSVYLRYGYNSSSALQNMQLGFANETPFVTFTGVPGNAVFVGTVTSANSPGSGADTNRIGYLDKANTWALAQTFTTPIDTGSTNAVSKITGLSPISAVKASKDYFVSMTNVAGGGWDTTRTAYLTKAQTFLQANTFKNLTTFDSTASHLIHGDLFYNKDSTDFRFFNNYITLWDTNKTAANSAPNFIVFYNSQSADTIWYAMGEQKTQSGKNGSERFIFEYGNGLGTSGYPNGARAVTIFNIDTMKNFDLRLPLRIDTMKNSQKAIIIVYNTWMGLIDTSLTALNNAPAGFFLYSPQQGTDSVAFVESIQKTQAGKAGSLQFLLGMSRGISASGYPDGTRLMVIAKIDSSHQFHFNAVNTSGMPFKNVVVDSGSFLVTLGTLGSDSSANKNGTSVWRNNNVYHSGLGPSFLGAITTGNATHNGNLTVTGAGTHAFGNSTNAGFTISQNAAAGNNINWFYQSAGVNRGKLGFNTTSMIWAYSPRNFAGSDLGIAFQIDTTKLLTAFGGITANNLTTLDSLKVNGATSIGQISSPTSMFAVKGVNTKLNLEEWSSSSVTKGAILDTNFGFTRLGKDTTTGKYGVSVVVADIDSTSQTAAIASIKFPHTSNGVGKYRLSYQLATDASSATGGNVTLNLAWNNGIAAQTYASAPLLTTGLGSAIQDVVYIYLGSGSLSYSTTFTRVTTETYELRMTLERVK